MRGKAERDSPVLMLLAPRGEYMTQRSGNTCILRKLSNSSRPREDGSNDCPVEIQQQHKKSAKVAISNSFCTVHVL